LNKIEHSAKVSVQKEGIFIPCFTKKARKNKKPTPKGLVLV